MSRSGQPQLRVCRGWQSPCEQVDLTTRQRVRAAEQGGSRLASSSNRFLAHVGRDFLPRDRLRPDRPCNSARASRYRLLDRRVTDACSRLCVQLPSPIALSQLGRREPGSEKKLASPPGLGQNQKRLDDPRHEIVIPAIRQVNRVPNPPRSEPTNHQAAATRLRPPDERPGGHRQEARSGAELVRAEAVRCTRRVDVQRRPDGQAPTRHPHPRALSTRAVQAAPLCQRPPRPPPTFQNDP